MAGGLLAVLVSAAALAAVALAGPPSRVSAPAGEPVRLSTPGAGGELWTLGVRQRRGSGIEYCLRMSRAAAGRKARSVGAACGLSTAIALRVNRHGLRPDCGAPGHVIGEPATADPTCGLVAADVQGVTVVAGTGESATAVLSEPFRLRYDRSSRILRRAGIDPARLRELPRTFRVRAFLAFVATPPTPPGGLLPRLTITGTRADGSTLSRGIGGGIFPAPPERPSPRPVPGAARARLALTAVDGRRWRSRAWLSVGGGLCAEARLAGHARRFHSRVCQGYAPLSRDLRWGPKAYTGTPGQARRRTYPVYGFVRGKALALTVIDRRGRRFAARLSRVFATIRRHGRVIRVRAFLAAVPGPPPSPQLGLELETKLSTGYTESVQDSYSPGSGPADE